MPRWLSTGFAAWIISLSCLTALWLALAQVADPRLLPSPVVVASFLVHEFANGELFYHLGVTLGRVAAAFTIAMVIGSALGLWLGRSRTADWLLDPWLVILLNLPAILVIVLAYIWFGLTEAAAIGAVAVNKIPNVAVTMREGARALDPAFGDVARSFQFSWAKELRHIVLPQLQPYLAATARSGIALIWKIVLVVELLGRPNGVGFQIHLFFQQFDIAGILGYTLAFVAVVLTVELFLLRPLDSHATRWRPRPA